MIFGFFRKDPRRALIAALYAKVADASRAPDLYARLGVPDTVEGRFESLCLHVLLVLRALRRLPPPAADVAGDLTDAFFRDLDATLREMGIGDTAVPKRMKRLGENYLGRVQAYDPPLERGDEAALAETLGRNVLGCEAPALGLARYALATDRDLARQNLDAILSGHLAFPQPDAFAGEGS